jgi:hypothetical protein
MVMIIQLKDMELNQQEFAVTLTKKAKVGCKLSRELLNAKARLLYIISDWYQPASLDFHNVASITKSLL